MVRQTYRKLFVVPGCKFYVVRHSAAKFVCLNFQPQLVNGNSLFVFHLFTCIGELLLVDIRDK